MSKSTGSIISLSTLLLLIPAGVHGYDVKDTPQYVRCKSKDEHNFHLNTRGTMNIFDVNDTIVGTYTDYCFPFKEGDPLFSKIYDSAGRLQHGWNKRNYSCSSENTVLSASSSECQWGCFDGACQKRPDHAVSCSGNGVDLFSKKTITVRYDNGIRNELTDYCHSNKKNTLVEFSCDDSVENKTHNEEFVCAYGCEDGRCLGGNLACVDTDGGSTLTQGEVTITNIDNNSIVEKQQDRCFDFHEPEGIYPHDCYDESGVKGNGVCAIEYTCHYNSVKNEATNCLCHNGRCLPEEVSVSCEDHNNDKYEKNEVVLRYADESEHVVHDVCINDRVLWEAECDDKKATYIEKFCRGGCNNGECAPCGDDGCPFESHECHSTCLWGCDNGGCKKQPPTKNGKDNSQIYNYSTHGYNIYVPGFHSNVNEFGTVRITEDQCFSYLENGKDILSKTSCNDKECFSSKVECALGCVGGACVLEEDMKCEDDIYRCPDGYVVTRNPHNNCDFHHCIASSLPGSKCNDSDGGVNLFVQGKAGYKNFQQGIDYCEDSNHVYEFFCAEEEINGKNYFKFRAQRYECQYGCKGGRCFQFPVSMSKKETSKSMLEEEQELIQIPEEVEIAFSDLGNDQLLNEAAGDLSTREVIHGYPDGFFKPARLVNRAEAAKMLVRALIPEDQLPNDYSVAIPFSDIARGAWYERYIAEAYERGILSGHPDGTLRPASYINTVELLKMLTIAFDLQQNAKHPFQDVERNSWYEQFVGIADSFALFPERGSWLSPARKLTRGEIAKALYLVLNEQEIKGKSIQKEKESAQSIENVIDKIGMHNFSRIQVELIEGVTVGENLLKEHFSLKIVKSGNVHPRDISKSKFTNLPLEIEKVLLIHDVIHVLYKDIDDLVSGSTLELTINNLPSNEGILLSGAKTLKNNVYAIPLQASFSVKSRTGSGNVLSVPAGAKGVQVMLLELEANTSQDIDIESITFADHLRGEVSNIEKAIVVVKGKQVGFNRQIDSDGLLTFVLDPPINIEYGNKIIAEVLVDISSDAQSNDEHQFILEYREDIDTPYGWVSYGSFPIAGSVLRIK